MPKIIDGNNQILTSGYGTGLTNKQKLARAWVLKPTVYSTETVAAGNGAGNATILSPTTTVSLVTTATNSTHVSLGKGVVQLWFDGTNWQVVAGEITGTAEMVIGS